MSKNHPILIIGAGIAGLAAAQRLAAANIPTIVLDKGKVVQDGTFDELSTIDGHFRKMWTHQTILVQEALKN